MQPVQTPDQLRAYFASLTYEEHAANQRCALERLRLTLEAHRDSHGAGSAAAAPASVLELLAEMAARRR